MSEGYLLSDFCYDVCFTWFCVSLASSSALTHKAALRGPSQRSKHSVIRSSISWSLVDRYRLTFDSNSDSMLTPKYSAILISVCFLGTVVSVHCEYAAGVIPIA